MAGATGLEPAASAVTGQRSNQLSYAPNQRKETLPKSNPRVNEKIGLAARSFANLRNKTAVEKLRRRVLLRRNAKALCLLAKAEQGSWIGRTAILFSFLS